MFESQKFLKPIYNLKELPKQPLPAVVLCGRSNVGKSTFINTLFNRKDLAKTSSAPGKTRSINYYSVDERFYLVDLPGYGYAKTSKKEREFWARLIGEYISLNREISLAIHLIDSRHKPTELDVKLNALLEGKKIPYLIVLSKADKLNQSEHVTALRNLKSVFPFIDTERNVIFHSSIKKLGKKEILKLFENLFYH